MALTADVKDELARLEITKNQVRAAELATILRFSGGLHLISGRIAVESELDSPLIVRRVRKDLAELYGVRSEAGAIASAANRKPGQFLVRVLDGETLARQTGLLDQRRRPIRGQCRSGFCFQWRSPSDCSRESSASAADFSSSRHLSCWPEFRCTRRWAHPSSSSR